MFHVDFSLFPYFKNFREKIKNLLKLVVIEHSLFTIPFIFVHLMLNFGEAANFEFLIYIVGAFLFARNFSMASNRVLDFYWDLKNLRTQNRELVKRKLSLREVFLFISMNIALFMLCMLKIHWIYFLLAPFYLVLLLFYSFWKRFSPYSHFYLGFIISFSLLVTQVIIYDALSLKSFFLFIAIWFWIASFDILYSILDYDFDIKYKLYSIPSFYGIDNSVRIFYICNLISFTCSIFIGILSINLGFFYYLFLILIFMHFLILLKKLRKRDIQNTLNWNLVISVYYFMGVFIDFILYNSKLN